MDLATLSVFSAVARAQSVTRAAELLRRAPSNVTTRIQQLEAEIGVALFERDKRRMELTAEGVTYLGFVDSILNLAEEAQQVVKPTEPLGTLRVGTMEATAAARLPILLAQFNARWPNVTLEVSTGPTAYLLEALVARRIDCAFIALPEKVELQAEIDRSPVFREDLVLLLPPGHPPVKVPGDIKPRSLAAFGPGCTYRALAEDWLKSASSLRAAPLMQELGSYHAMVACTAAGSCFSVMPQSVLDIVPNAASFTTKPLMRVDTWLATRAGFRTPSFEAFQAVVHQFSDISGGSHPTR